MPGAVPLLGKAGDAYVFPHAIWHGPSPNRSGKARKTILYNYRQMFMRPYDFGTPYAALFERCTARQRRLLGDLGHDFRPGDFFYAPEDQVMTGSLIPVVSTGSAAQAQAGETSSQLKAGNSRRARSLHFASLRSASVETTGCFCSEP